MSSNAPTNPSSYLSEEQPFDLSGARSRQGMTRMSRLYAHMDSLLSRIERPSPETHQEQPVIPVENIDLRE